MYASASPFPQFTSYENPSHQGRTCTNFTIGALVLSDPDKVNADFISCDS